MSMILQNNKGQSTEFTICDIGINNCILNKINYIYMEKYIAKMIEEHAQLTERLRKLEDYIYGQNGRDDDKIEFANKCVQLRGMRVYHDALSARLDNAGIYFDGEKYVERIVSMKEVLNNPIPKDNCDCKRKPTDEE